MNIKEIKEMINLMNENNLSELEVEKEGMRIRLKKNSSGEIMVDNSRNRVILPPAESFVPQSAPPAPAKETPKEKSQAKGAEIKSPMVGTFYRAPSPESPTFVEIGQDIEVGQVICIIEAMKLMNEIKSEIKGKIVDILVSNAEPVEFSQPLFLIEPA